MRAAIDRLVYRVTALSFGGFYLAITSDQGLLGGVL